MSGSQRREGNFRGAFNPRPMAIPINHSCILCASQCICGQPVALLPGWSAAPAYCCLSSTACSKSCRARARSPGPPIDKVPEAKGPHTLPRRQLQPARCISLLAHLPRCAMPNNALARASWPPSPPSGRPSPPPHPATPPLQQTHGKQLATTCNSAALAGRTNLPTSLAASSAAKRRSFSCRSFLACTDTLASDKRPSSCSARGMGVANARQRQQSLRIPSQQGC